MSLQNLFIAKLPRNLTDKDLFHLFEEYKPNSAKIMLDAGTGKSKGFGFVLFPNEEDGKKAYEALNRKSVRCCGHNFTLVIYPSEHDGRNADVASKALYIRNVPLNTSKEDVKAFLNSFGNLTYCAMREDHYGNPVWVIYAEYETVDHARNALTKIHGNSTYFQHSAPLLAKYEDTDYAKSQRRKRREGTHSTVPNSGTIFPPPRPESNQTSKDCIDVLKNHSTSSNNNSNNNNNSNSYAIDISTTSNINAFMHNNISTYSVGSGLSFNNMSGPPNAQSNSNFLMSGGSSFPYSAFESFPTASADPLLFHSPNYNIPPIGSNSPSNPATHSNGLLPNTNFGNSMPLTSNVPTLLHPTPGYCYTLGESGQQIFIPSSSLGQGNMLASAPVRMTNGGSPGNERGPDLLQPKAPYNGVFQNGSQQFVLSPEAVNYNPNRIATGAGSPGVEGSPFNSLDANGATDRFLAYQSM